MEPYKTTEKKCGLLQTYFLLDSYKTVLSCLYVRVCRKDIVIFFLASPLKKIHISLILLYVLLPQNKYYNAMYRQTESLMRFALKLFPVQYFIYNFLYCYYYSYYVLYNFRRIYFCYPRSSFLFFFVFLILEIQDHIFFVSSLNCLFSK